MPLRAVLFMCSDWRRASAIIRSFSLSSRNILLAPANDGRGFLRCLRSSFCTAHRIAHRLAGIVSLRVRSRSGGLNKRSTSARGGLRSGAYGAVPPASRTRPPGHQDTAAGHWERAEPPERRRLSPPEVSRHRAATLLGAIVSACHSPTCSCELGQTLGR